jgi:hypothetical protein
LLTALPLKRCGVYRLVVQLFPQVLLLRVESFYLRQRRVRQTGAAG